ncbi:MAG TPA: formyl transferase [Sphingomicrobium sp.]|nr:formyl transferase [Sphingomicrobium sp.]
MDIWKVGIVRRSVKDILVKGFEGAGVQWLEEQRPFCFLADPFGVWRKDNLAVFAEAYDYRSRLGRIDAFLLDRDLRLVERRTCLTEQWHLSYPFLFDMRGELWMLPEAHRSGRLTLYRNHDFPFGWKPEMIIDVPEPAVDATVTFHEGLWWLFYSPVGRPAPTRLHAAFAECIDGPWILHPANPLLVGDVGSRPGGTPFCSGEGLIVPAQNSEGGYGSGISMLTLAKLTPDIVELRIGASLNSPVPRPFDAGLHTLSAAGDITLIDVKRNEQSLSRLPVDALGRFRRAYRGWFQQ